MNFHDVRFPSNLSFGSIGGPERRTDIVTLANGFEERNTPWAHGRRRYDAGISLRSLDDVSAMIAFFEARQGQLYGFGGKIGAFSNLVYLPKTLAQRIKLLVKVTAKTKFSICKNSTDQVRRNTIAPSRNPFKALFGCL